METYYIPTIVNKNFLECKHILKKSQTTKILMVFFEMVFFIFILHTVFLENVTLQKLFKISQSLFEDLHSHEIQLNYNNVVEKNITNRSDLFCPIFMFNT